MSLNGALLDKIPVCDIASSPSTLERYPKNIHNEVRQDLHTVAQRNDARIIPDPIIEKFLDYVIKRYYQLWFYIRGIPKLAIPMLITGCQKLFQNLYVNGCSTMNGERQLPSDCILCNGNQTTHEGNLDFRYVDYIIIVIGILLISVVLRRGIAEAHLCTRVLKYKIHVRASWYYWNHILLIAAVGIICAALSLISSIFASQVNAETAQITCQEGILKGQTIQLRLSDYEDNLFFWIALYAVSVISYWPIINFLVDLYDTPLKIFIEPEDMFKMNGEIKGQNKLFSRLAMTEQKVRLRFLLHEINGVYDQVKRRRPFRVERIPDELLEVAILRLYNKGKMKEFKQKV